MMSTVPVPGYRASELHPDFPCQMTYFWEPPVAPGIGHRSRWGFLRTGRCAHYRGRGTSPPSRQSYLQEHEEGLSRRAPLPKG